MAGRCKLEDVFPEFSRYQTPTDSSGIFGSFFLCLIDFGLFIFMLKKSSKITQRTIRSY